MDIVGCASDMAVIAHLLPKSGIMSCSIYLKQKGVTTVHEGTSSFVVGT